MVTCWQEGGEVQDLGDAWGPQASTRTGRVGGKQRRVVPLVVLDDEEHLSYPFVFEAEGKVKGRRSGVCMCAH